jgi:hypothetical protein
MPPKIIRPFLWFNDLKRIDLEKDKNRIILNVLNIGTKKATDWLFNFYGRSVVKRIVVNYGAKGELSPKSLNYWVILLNINPKKINASRL